MLRCVSGLSEGQGLCGDLRDQQARSSQAGLDPFPQPGAAPGIRHHFGDRDWPSGPAQCGPQAGQGCGRLEGARAGGGAPGAGRGLPPLRALTRSLFEEDDSQRKTNMFLLREIEVPVQ